MKTTVGGSVYEGVIVGWVPPSLPPFIKEPPLIIASTCPCPYANRFSEVVHIDSLIVYAVAVNNKTTNFSGLRKSYF